MSPGVAAQAQTKVFSKPKVGGDRLDLCLNWGTGGGEPAADTFCTAKEFARAKYYAIDPDLGSVSWTRLITTGAVCGQAF